MQGRSEADYLPVQAIAETAPKASAEGQYFPCNQREFSELEYRRSTICQEVARTFLQQRRSNEAYRPATSPIWICPPFDPAGTCKPGHSTCAKSPTT